MTCGYYVAYASFQCDIAVVYYKISDKTLEYLPLKVFDQIHAADDNDTHLVLAGNHNPQKMLKIATAHGYSLHRHNATCPGQNESALRTATQFVLVGK